MVRFLTIASVLLIVTGATMAADPYAGIWAEKKAWCGLRHDNTDIWDRIPLKITADHLSWVTLDCRIKSRKARGPSMTVKALCEGDGERATATYTLTLSGDGKRLRLAQSGQPTVSYLRCE
jgi:hypothetical protein